MNANDDKRIAEIRERCEKATTGPWVIDRTRLVASATADWMRDMGWKVELGRLSADETRLAGGELENHANKCFIANARSDIPYLLEKITALESQLDQRPVVANSATTAEIPTPRSDVLNAVELQKYPVSYKPKHMLDFARQLERELSVALSRVTALEAKLAEAEKWLRWFTGSKHDGECAFTDKAEEGCYKCSEAQREKWPQLIQFMSGSVELKWSDPLD